MKLMKLCCVQLFNGGEVQYGAGCPAHLACQGIELGRPLLDVIAATFRRVERHERARVAEKLGARPADGLTTNINEWKDAPWSAPARRAQLNGSQ